MKTGRDYLFGKNQVTPGISMNKDFRKWLGQIDYNLHEYEYESLKLLWNVTETYNELYIPNASLMWKNIKRIINKYHHIT
jgi:hypothetical protein